MSVLSVEAVFGLTTEKLLDSPEEVMESIIRTAGHGASKGAINMVT
ncbi:hypothetical protein ACFLTG_00170 [Chloroflexota bacterium]